MMIAKWHGKSLGPNACLLEQMSTSTVRPNIFSNFGPEGFFFFFKLEGLRARFFHNFGNLIFVQRNIEKTNRWYPNLISACETNARWEQALRLQELIQMLLATVPLSVAFRFFQHVEDLNRCLNTHLLGVTKNLESSQAHLDSDWDLPNRGFGISSWQKWHRIDTATLMKTRIDWFLWIDPALAWLLGTNVLYGQCPMPSPGVQHPRQVVEFSNHFDWPQYQNQKNNWFEWRKRHISESWSQKSCCAPKNENHFGSGHPLRFQIINQSYMVDQDSHRRLVCWEISMFPIHILWIKRVVLVSQTMTQDQLRIEETTFLL